VSLSKNSKQLYIENNLATFAGLLRQEGLPVGTMEIIDALRALEVTDISSRTSFKTALLATMVKSRKDEYVFDRLFEHYFIHYNEHCRRSEEMLADREELTRQLSEAAGELSFKGEQLGLSEEELKQYNGLPLEHRGRLLDFVQKTENGNKVEPHFKPILENIVKSHLRYCRSKEDQQPGSSITDADGAGSGSGTGADLLLREMDIEKIATSELPAAEDLLVCLSRKLAVKILRRRRSGPRSGQLDIRRSLRCNMQYGGTIFDLKYKPKRRSKQQILMLCDVSASMKNYSTFVIHFMHNLHEVVRDLFCFTFSDNLEDLTDALKGRTSLQYLLDRVIRNSKNWGGGTDFGAALKALEEKEPHRLNHKTTVIIVSDTKTVALDSAVKALSKMKERVKRVIWLNPLAAERWPDYRSVAMLAGQAEMWPCSTIGQLEEALTNRI